MAKSLDASNRRTRRFHFAKKCRTRNTSKRFAGCSRRAIFEEKLASLYRGGMITGGVYIGRGQEAVSAACGMFLQERRRLRAAHSRPGRALRFWRTAPRCGAHLSRLALRARCAGATEIFIAAARETGQLAMISHLGAMISVVVGKLLAKRMKGEKDFVGLTTIGEGGMQTGATHEGMNIAAVEHVPFVIVATNNHYAYSTPNDRAFACADLVDRAIGLRLRRHSVDGTDLAAMSRRHRRRGETRAGRRSAAAGRRVDFAPGRPWRTRRRQLCDRRRSKTNRSRRIRWQRTEKLILDEGWPIGDDCSRWRAEAVAAEVETKLSQYRAAAKPRRTRARKKIGARLRSRESSVDRHFHERHLPRSDPRSAGAFFARRRARLHLRAGC